MFDILPNRKGSRDLFKFDHFFSEFFPQMEGRLMKLDIKEFDTYYRFDVELPGVEKDDININVKQDILTISVLKHEETNEENTKFIRKERKFGSYSRSFTIPDINSDQISANFENGVLKLTLAKMTPEERPTKSIPIE